MSWFRVGHLLWWDSPFYNINSIDWSLHYEVPEYTVLIIFKLFYLCLALWFQKNHRHLNKYNNIIRHGMCGSFNIKNPYPAALSVYNIHPLEVTNWKWNFSTKQIDWQNKLFDSSNFLTYFFASQIDFLTHPLVPQIDFPTNQIVSHIDFFDSSNCLTYFFLTCQKLNYYKK